jgi:hypothetical protein
MIYLTLAITEAIQSLAFQAIIDCPQAVIDDAKAVGYLDEVDYGALQIEAEYF